MRREDRGGGGRVVVEERDFSGAEKVGARATQRRPRRWRHVELEAGAERLVVRAERPERVLHVEIAEVRPGGALVLVGEQRVVHVEIVARQRALEVEREVERGARGLRLPG